MVKKVPKAPKMPEGESVLKLKNFILTDEFDTVKDGTTLIDGVKKLLDMKRGVLLVKSDEDAVIGVITERKILKHIADGEDPKAMTVNNAMDTHILTLLADAEVEKALDEIKSAKPAAVIVNDAEGKFRGYFSPIDYVEAEKKLKQLKAAHAAGVVRE